MEKGRFGSNGDILSFENQDRFAPESRRNHHRELTAAECHEEAFLPQVDQQSFSSKVALPPVEFRRKLSTTMIYVTLVDGQRIVTSKIIVPIASLFSKLNLWEEVLQVGDKELTFQKHF